MVQKKTNKTWVIYKHTLIADCQKYGWSYIGQTSKKNPEDRWASNGTNYTRKNANGAYTYFANEILSYGWENFKTEILESGIVTQAEADLKERYWIAYYHTYIKDPECRGFNLTPGGYGGGGILNRVAINNGIVEKRIFKDEPIPEGFVLGSLKRDCGAKVSAAKKCKPSKSRGKQWFNNGVEQTMANKCPEGWVPGRLPHQRPGLELYNNGVEQKCFAPDEEIPNGWAKGKIPGTHNTPNKGKILYNNGISHIYLNKEEIPPDGFIKGSSIERSKLCANNGKPSKGKRWYNNGVIQRYFAPNDPIPDGWTPGCCKSRSYLK